MKSGGRYKPAIKMKDNLLLTYLLMKRQFLILILSGSFTIFDLKKKGAVMGIMFVKMNQA